MYANLFTQLRVLAKDGGSPPQSATAIVEVNVERNLFDPKFTAAGTIRASVAEIAPAGTSVWQLTATDSDVSVRF